MSKELKFEQAITLICAFYNLFYNFRNIFKF